MQKFYIYGALIMCVIGGYFYYYTSAIHKASQAELPRSSVYIQYVAKQSAFDPIKQQLTAVINTIVKNELNLGTDYDFDFFLPKQATRLTIYYVNSIADDGLPMVCTALERMVSGKKDLFVLQQVSFVPEVHLFGDHKDELVIMVHDSSNALHTVHSEVKDMMHTMNATYRHTHEVYLYKVHSSERFAYVPHVGIGRIREASIKKHIQEPEKVDEIYAAIIDRIMQEAAKLVHANQQELSGSIVFNRLHAFDVAKKRLVWEYVLLQ